MTRTVRLPLLAVVVLTGSLAAGCKSSSSRPQETVEAPQFSPAAGSYQTDQRVAISCATSGAAIHYTLDGSEPTAASPVYSSPIPVAGDGTTLAVKAVAVKSDMKDSAVTSALYVIDYDQVSAPVFSPAAGTYDAAQGVAIRCATKDTVVFYTIDGSDPDEYGVLYTGPVQVSKDTTIRAIAYDYRTDLAASDVATSEYLFIPPATSATASTTPESHNEATITWDPAPNAESYNIYYRQGTGVTESNGIKLSNVTSPYRLPDLPTDAYYSFIVTAQNHNGEGEASAVASAKIPGHWEVLGAAGLSDDAAGRTEIGVAPNGTVYVLYADAAAGGKATVKAYGSGTWVPVGAAGFSAGEISCPRIAVDSNDVVYVAYRNAGSDSISVQRYDNALLAWEPVGSNLDGITTAVTLYTLSLATAPDDTPYIAFADWGSGGKATVMRLAGDTWEVAGTAGFSDYPVDPMIDGISLTVSNDGTPYVAYMSGSSPDSRVGMVERLSGSEWTEVGRAATFPLTLKIMTDSRGAPYVGFTRQVPAAYGALDMRPRMVSYRTIEGVARFWGLPTSTSSADDPLVHSSYTSYYSIAMDANDTAYAVFQADRQPYSAMVRRFNAVSNAWEGVGMDQISASSATEMSIAIDRNSNTPYVAFVDGASSAKATVMVYR